MDRRGLLALLLVVPATVLAQPAVPHHKVSAAQLHRSLSARFPVRAVATGWVELRVSAPALLLLPARNRLGATLLIEAAGIFGSLPPGEVDIAMRLRWEPGDRSVRGWQPEVLGLRWPALPPHVGAAVQQALPELVREVTQEVVLHEFTEQELALPDTMGLEPGSFTVVEDGLVIGFAAKR